MGADNKQNNVPNHEDWFKNNGASNQMRGFVHTSSDARARRQASWLKLWEQRGLKNYVLLPLSFLYRLVTFVRRVFYSIGVMDIRFAPVPVVVVGGIMVGGVGKTPVVKALAKTLRQAGYRPGIIARGYGGSNANNHCRPMAVTASSQSAVVGDEPILHALTTECPVWVGVDRAAVARALCAAHPEVDVLICDDGLQHYKLARDIEIVIMDHRGTGNGWCLPAGPLRENISRLKEVDAVVWHRRGGQEMCPISDAVVKTPQFTFESYISDAYDLMNPTDRVPLSFFSGKSVAMMAAIAQPATFFKMLAEYHVLGTEVPLSDHAPIGLSTLMQPALSHNKFILMTEKDAVKCRALLQDTPENQGRYWVAPLEVMATQELKSLQAFLIEQLEDLRTPR